MLQRARGILTLLHVPSTRNSADGRIDYLIRRQRRLSFCAHLATVVIQLSRLIWQAFVSNTSRKAITIHCGTVIVSTLFFDSKRRGRLPNNRQRLPITINILRLLKTGPKHDMCLSSAFSGVLSVQLPNGGVMTPAVTYFCPILSGIAMLRRTGSRFASRLPRRIPSGEVAMSHFCMPRPRHETVLP